MNLSRIFQPRINTDSFFFSWRLRVFARDSLFLHAPKYAKTISRQGAKAQSLNPWLVWLPV